MEKAANNRPLVSICLITYNHERYIRQAVDSIINQEMNFKYELLIADDASTDSTQKILVENYSNNKNIRLILREKNSKGKNSYLTFREAKGKYIYVCEGDDYWLGQDGLQTLVSWIENNQQYVGVCGRRINLSEKTGLMSVMYNRETDNREISLNDFLYNNLTFDRCATLYRNFYYDGQYDYRHYLACKKVGDLTNNIYMLLHGKIYQLDKIVGVYRSDRVKNTECYNKTNNSQKIYEDYMELITNLPLLINKNLDYSKRKKEYVNWYVHSLPSTYEVIKNIPYIAKRSGIKIAIETLKERIESVKKLGE